ncbi:MAG TPA: hypothetical protein VF053_03200, partial [Streptosporangiales bacterium]
HRVLTGAPIWMKPAKFAISMSIYGFTLAWLLSLLTRFRRAGRVLGTVIAFMAAGELVVIVGQVVRGQTSHFNYTTPLNAALFEAMAGMIVVLWLANLAVGVLLLLQRIGDRSTSWALRLGTAIALAGMAVAFFMPQARPDQMPAIERTHGATVIGAHSVGVADGGPGLPIVGWSTVGGDLRIPHFIGIHGLQVLILAGLLLAALAGRYPVLAADAVRTRLVVVTGLGYAGVLVLTTWQALRAQSVVHPDALTAGVFAGIVAFVAVGTVLALRSGRRPATPAPVERMEPVTLRPVA